VNDYVDMGNPTAAQITSDLTLSSWVYLSSNTANQDIIAKEDSQVSGIPALGR